MYGLKRKGVNASGAIFGLFTAIILSIASYMFLACLAAFFFTSSRATRFRADQKRRIEVDFKGGEGRRNWVQVLCNAGSSALLALLYLLDCGSGERPIDFGRQYRASWLAVGIMSSFACCNGDTWASELGTVLCKSNPFLITTRKRVPRGTNGGVTLIGLIVSFLGGVVIGLAYYLVVKFTLPSNVMIVSPAQWPIIVFGGAAGLLGSIIDSIIGATLQYSGKNSLVFGEYMKSENLPFTGQDEKGKIVEKPGPNIKHISGYSILDNHSVNLISSILTGILMPFIALNCWP